jgi:hypothetical protein
MPMTEEKNIMNTNETLTIITIQCRQNKGSAGISRNNHHWQDQLEKMQ